ncbi:MAG: nicotinate-nucleotide adenylyltransferase [Planctomycetaceae bacterium]|jgi:nicotinate-nucleotide adenylyltransferase|nr:nicotinate-nucleotide adenylyltransferase [Planctomycetaceae bacterium]
MGIQLQSPRNGESHCEIVRSAHFITQAVSAKCVFQKTQMKRYGIYGGAFDPVHLGHLLSAQTSLNRQKLDEIIFVPTGVSPHRTGKHSYQTAAEHRFAMLEAATADCPEFSVSRIEIDKKEISFTVETLRYFRQTLPKEAELFLLLGADMFNDLPNWYEPAEICRLAVPAAVCRPDFPKPDFEALGNFVSVKRLKEIRRAAVDMPPIGISSTVIRQQITAGQRIRFQVPVVVEAYIVEHNLYRTE